MALPSQMLLLCAALLLACTPAGAAHRLLQATNQPPLTSSVDPASETIPSTAVISPDILLPPADPVAAAAATAESIRDRSPVTVVTLAADVIAAAAAEAPLDPAEVAAAQAAFKALRLPLDGPAATSAPLTPGFSGFGTPGPLNLDPEQAGLTQDGFYRCSAPKMSRAQQRAQQRDILKIQRAQGATLAPANTGTPTIRVWFHVIRTGLLQSQGNVPDSWLVQQLSVLNAAFAGRYTFQLAGTTRTTNSTWFTMTPGSRAETDATNTLRVGGMSTLNFYTAGLTGGALGWAYFPTSTFNRRDGVMCKWTTLPNTAVGAPYNLGDTGTHEVGHWLNLFHTFEGGSCSSTNDRVTDTPAVSGPSYGCPRPKDTCSSPGADQTNNFMDYTDDRCMDLFTAGQFTRTRTAWDTLRAGR